MTEVTEGQFSTGLPYLKLGEGPPLIQASSLSSQHANPQGLGRRMAVSWAAAFAKHFTIYLTNRRPDLATGATMSDIAADYAVAIEQDLGEPVMLHGTSAGGSVALQLAIDHPTLVRRLVVAASACRLPPEVRQIQAEAVRLAQHGEGRRALALYMGSLVPRPVGFAARGLGWVMGGGFTPEKRSDMLITLDAECMFDAEPELSHVQAAALVLGGTDDRFYTAELFRRTAAGIPDGRAVILPGKSHGYVAGSKETAGMALDFLLGRGEWSPPDSVS
jgi:pimeloyl-ACP methyl ester carboxylesterase